MNEKPDAAREQAYADFLHFSRMVPTAAWAVTATLAQATAANRVAFLLSHHEPAPAPGVAAELAAVKSQLSRLAAAASRLMEFPSSVSRHLEVENLLKEIVFSDIDNRVKQQ